MSREIWRPSKTRHKYVEIYVVGTFFSSFSSCLATRPNISPRNFQIPKIQIHYWIDEILSEWQQSFLELDISSRKTYFKSRHNESSTHKSLDNIRSFLRIENLIVKFKGFCLFCLSFFKISPFPKYINQIVNRLGSPPSKSSNICLPMYMLRSVTEMLRERLSWESRFVLYARSM